MGLGRALIARLIDEAVLIGYEELLLDSARYMEQAHRLYRSLGFTEITPYPGSEVPKAFEPHWIFMRLALSKPNPISLNV
jgi:ribosomal protein S18 acetylase RimI-like enzyme